MAAYAAAWPDRPERAPAPRAPRLRLAAPRIPEDDLHAQVARALDLLLMPPAEWTTFPAGGYLLSEAARGRLFRLGLKTAWPDMLIVHGGAVHGIELKARDGVLSKTRVVHTKQGRPRLVIGQAEMHPRLAAAGMELAVCRTLDAVLAQLRVWEIPLREIRT